MATDVFMDMLTARVHLDDAKAQRAKAKKTGPVLGIPGLKPEPPKSLGKRIEELSLPPEPTAPIAAASELPSPNSRPDFADDIDRIVRELEADGLIVFDGEAQCYRRPNVRRWRFA